jgi:hypothetical protein
VRPPGQTQQLQSPLGAEPNNNKPAKLTNTFPPLIPEGPPQAPGTQQADATHQWIVNLNTQPQNNTERGHTGGGINGPGQREEATTQAQFLPTQQFKQQHKRPRHDFPKFDGTATCAWIKKAEKYFKLCHII